MIYNTIFKEAIMRKNDGFEYTYKCSKFIYMMARIENIDMLEYLECLNYPSHYIKRNRVLRLIEEMKYINTDIYYRDYHIYKSLKNEIENYSFEELVDILSSIDLSTIKKEKLAILLDAIYAYSENKKVICDEISWRLIFEEPDFDTLIELIRDFQEFNNSLLLKNFFVGTINSILSYLKLFTVNDLLKLKPEILLVVFSKHKSELIDLLSILSRPNERIFIDRIDELEFDLKHHEIIYDVLIKRFAFFEKEKTLEELASIHGLTRERIRQLEAKGIKDIISFRSSILPYLSLFLLSLFKEKSMVTLNEVKDKYGNKIAGYLKIFILKYELDYEYSEKYEIFYPRGYLQHLIENCLDSLPLIIQNHQYLELSSFEKKIIDEHYSLRSNDKLMRSGLKYSDIYCLIIDEFFPNGFNADESSMKIVNEQLTTNYYLPEINAHALSSTLARLDFCLIDRGTVINRKYVVELPDDLVEKIIKYILTSNGVVYYVTLFETFKEELESIGVKNRYYLKGVLDYRLPDFIKTKRDYILTNEEYTPHDAILSEINSIDGIIDIEILKQKFPGLKDYVFLNHIYNMPNVVWYSWGKRFILLDKIKFNPLFKTTVEKEAEYLFKSLNSDVITADKLYSRMKIIHKNIMSETPEIENSFIFYSIVCVMLEGKYKFRRPYICRGNIDVSYELILNNYLKNVNSFNLDSINSFILKMNMKKLYSYLDFMVSHSEDFVQINIDTCVKKELFKIDQEQLKLIKNSVIYYINSFGDIHSNIITIFDELPKLKYPWNKYLLIGIIRTFLNNDFIIEYTDSMYHKTEFIIRRNK